MHEVKPQKIKDTTVSVPGSKSYTHRMLIAAALADGTSRIQNCLKSEDTLLTLNALKKIGVAIDESKDPLIVVGTKGVLQACREPIYLGNSGTSMRLLTAVLAMGNGTYTLTGTKRMQARPIQDLLEGLSQLGVTLHSIGSKGCPPIEIKGKALKGGPVRLNCGTSSQYLSALLLIAPYTQNGLDIEVTHGPVSKPYIDMTVDVMKKMGISVQRNEYRTFRINGDQMYKSGSYIVEPDASQAGYFWSAAAISGAAVKVRNIFRNSRQGDVRFTYLLESMGCRVIEEPDGITVIGGPLNAIEADMADMPDLVPTLAVIAAFAKGTTIITNVGHLKAKESDRLDAVATELHKMGIEAISNDTGLAVTGGIPHGAHINTYNDHRIAMSFAVAGLKTPGIVIQDERCVEKSFPDFWKVFENLY